MRRNAKLQIVKLVIIQDYLICTNFKFDWTVEIDLMYAVNMFLVKGSQNMVC